MNWILDLKKKLQRGEITKAQFEKSFTLLAMKEILDGGLGKIKDNTKNFIKKFKEAWDG